MTETGPDIDTVSALIAEVGRDVILPRFRSLEPQDIERKQTVADPDDLVTVVDRQAEERLTTALLSIGPGSTVIGEEAAYADPGILERLASDDPVWLLDPIDGTRNFVAGSDRFGVMLAYVVGGETRAAWIHFPARNETFVAESGGGALLNGERLKLSGPGTLPPRGVLHMRFMPRATRVAVEFAAAGRYEAGYDARSAAVEYTEVLRGGRDFAVYYRLLPWDHAAPALILGEGGGLVEHLTGQPYRPRSADQITIVAGSRETMATVRGWFGRPQG